MSEKNRLEEAQELSQSNNVVLPPVPRVHYYIDGRRLYDARMMQVYARWAVRRYMRSQKNKGVK